MHRWRLFKYCKKHKCWRMNWLYRWDLTAYQHQLASFCDVWWIYRGCLLCICNVCTLYIVHCTRTRIARAEILKTTKRAGKSSKAAEYLKFDRKYTQWSNDRLKIRLYSIESLWLSNQVLVMTNNVHTCSIIYELWVWDIMIYLYTFGWRKGIYSV